jgi:ATP-binding cassette, subfamily B, multidrug efflux pump
MTVPMRDPFSTQTSVNSGFAANLWRLRHWLKPYRWQLFIAVLFAMLSTSASILMPIVFSRVIIDDILTQNTLTQVPDLGQRALTAWLTDTLQIQPLLAAGALYLLWMLLRSLFSYGFETRFPHAMLAGLNELRQDLFAHVEHLPPVFYDRVRVGQVLTRITSDIESLSELLLSVGGILAEIIPFAVAISVMWSLDATLLFELSPLLLLVVLCTWLFRHLTGSIYQRIRETHSRLNEHLHENLSGIESVQLAQRETLNQQRFADLVSNNRYEENRAIRIETAYFPIIENVVYLAVAVVIWFGGQHVLQQKTTLGSIILFLQFNDMLFRPVMMIGYQASVIFRAAVACERIFRLLDWRETLAIPAQAVTLPADLYGRIEFKNLNFSYASGEPVLKNFNLLIEPGETLAIVGATGSGKTTLTRLICHFYDVEPNSLFIDNIDIMQIAPKDIRQRVGIILQDFHLFPGTVLDNITLGNPAITRDMAISAATCVQALDFINALPQGFDTWIQAQGNNISQGQRQLLVFARVIAQDPEILILDEATASIDSSTEAAIQKALTEITAQRTTLIIAHRLQTIRDADRIIVLKNGVLVESGRHEELLNLNGHYAGLYAAQFSDV